MDMLEYRLLRAGEEEAALNFFYSHFVAKEGQLSSVGAGRNEEVTRDIQTMLTSGPTLVAIDADGQMVGQLIMEIHDQGGDTSGPPSFQDILSRYEDVAWSRFWHLGSSQVLWPPTFLSAFPTLDRILDLGFLSVSSQWQGKGVATKLATNAEQLARDKNCQGMVVIASTTATVKIVERLGMVKWRGCKWMDYCDEDGKTVFDVPSAKGDGLQSFYKIFK